MTKHKHKKQKMQQPSWTWSWKKKKKIFRYNLMTKKMMMIATKFAFYKTYSHVFFFMLCVFVFCVCDVSSCILVFDTVLYVSIVWDMVTNVAVVDMIP